MPPIQPMAHEKDTLEAELSENEDGFCTLQVQSKRGSDTRDEDRVKATLGRPTLAEIEDECEAFLAMIEETMAECRAANHPDEG